MWTPDICLYHFPCDDGFAAAWCARRRWPDIEMAPTNYGQPLPDVDFAGKNVLIADFSYKPDVLRSLGQKANSVVVLDHHKTAAEDLDEFPVKMVGARYDAIERTLARLDGPDTNIIVSFDMDRSGAMMTWEFCFPDDPAPAFIKHIQDRDLWRFALEGTRALSLYLRSFDFDFDVWDQIAERMESDPEATMAEAESIERFYDRKLAEMLPTATVKKIGNWDGVPVAHAPYAFASDLAHEMLKSHPDAPFAAVVVDAYGGRTYSLRSEDSREDVAEVARSFGGGGHRNAAGFRVPA